MQKRPPASHEFFLTRKWMVLFCLLAVVVLSVLVKVLLFSPLPRGAYPILSTNGWLQRWPRRSLVPEYFWLPNGDLSYTETNSRGVPQVFYRKVDTADSVGAIRPGPELPLGPSFANVVPSPDEKYVAYTRTTNVLDLSSHTDIISTDGTSQCSVNEEFCGWLSDSRSFLSYCRVAPLSLRVRHLDSPRMEKLPGITGGFSFPVFIATRPAGPNFLIGGTFIQFCPELPEGNNYPRMTMRTFETSHPDHAPKTWQVSVPRNARDGDAIPSPDNKHLLWIINTVTPNPIAQWIHRLFPKRPLGITERIDFFLTDLQGNHRRPILQTGINGSPYIAPQWTPDSKHLSFVYNEQLYLVPVD